MNKREEKFYITNRGPFAIYGCNLLIATHVATEGCYVDDQGNNLGNCILQKIIRFDEKGNFLPQDQWFKEPLKNTYWWIVGNQRIEIKKE